MPRADLFVARGLCVLLALLAVETLLNLILEIYRPRLKGRVARPLYDSRLVGLLAHPEDLFSTAAHALDYQFGFKVSETWAYRMVGEKLPLFILGLACAIVVSSCFVFVDPGEQVLVERFGRSATESEILGPGAHLKLPWPIDRAFRFETGRIQSFSVGFVPDPARENDQTIVWTLSHYKEEYNLLVASRDQQFSTTATNQAEAEQSVPVNLLVAGIPIQYRITNVLDWAYGHSNPGDLLQQLATREIVRYFAGVDVLEIMSVNREKAATELRSRIQTRANELRLGADVLFVGLQDIHPPVAVASAYEDVNAAAQELEAKILRAQGETNRTVLLAQSEALEKVRVAEANALRRTTSAAAQASRFTNQISAYQASPSVYPTRVHLQSFINASINARKIIVAPTNAQETFQLNLEDSIRPDLMEGLTVRTNR
jgi:regulator of protease activity HflC (stomatin/prohibitin superfamily)